MGINNYIRIFDLNQSEKLDSDWIPVLRNIRSTLILQIFQILVRVSDIIKRIRIKHMDMLLWIVFRLFRIHFRLFHIYFWLLQILFRYFGYFCYFMYFFCYFGFFFSILGKKYLIHTITNEYWGNYRFSKSFLEPTQTQNYLNRTRPKKQKYMNRISNPKPKNLKEPI